jgi:hypothetical protein
MDNSDDETETDENEPGPERALKCDAVLTRGTGGLKAQTRVFGLCCEKPTFVGE